MGSSYNPANYAAAQAVPCRHCRLGKVTRPRGLCWVCYYAPGVRELYGPPRPETAKFAGRGTPDTAGDRPPAAAPTTAPPGTPEKLAVLEARAQDGVRLFHPADARFAGDRRPLAYLAAAASRPRPGGRPRRR